MLQAAKIVGVATGTVSHNFKLHPLAQLDIHVKKYLVSSSYTGSLALRMNKNLRLDLYY